MLDIKFLLIDHIYSKHEPQKGKTVIQVTQQIDTFILEWHIWFMCDSEPQNQLKSNNSEVVSSQIFWTIYIIDACYICNDAYRFYLDVSWFG